MIKQKKVTETLLNYLSIHIFSHSVTTFFENVFTAKDNLNETIERIDVEQALVNLNSKDNELVYLVFQAQLSYQEISAILDIPVGTVKSRMSSIKTKLKTLLSWEG